jgi:hypothetical protein
MSRWMCSRNLFRLWDKAFSGRAGFSSLVPAAWAGLNDPPFIFPCEFGREKNLGKCSTWNTPEGFVFCVMPITSKSFCRLYN